MRSIKEKEEELNLFALLKHILQTVKSCLSALNKRHLSLSDSSGVKLAVSIAAAIRSLEKDWELSFGLG